MCYCAKCLIPMLIKSLATSGVFLVWHSAHTCYSVAQRRLRSQSGCSSSKRYAQHVVMTCLADVGIFCQDNEETDVDINIRSVYTTMWNICKLKRMHIWMCGNLVKFDRDHRCPDAIDSAPHCKDRVPSKRCRNSAEDARKGTWSRRSGIDCPYRLSFPDSWRLVGWKMVEGRWAIAPLDIYVLAPSDLVSTCHFDGVLVSYTAYLDRILHPLDCADGIFVFRWVRAILFPPFTC